MTEGLAAPTELKSSKSYDFAAMKPWDFMRTARSIGVQQQEFIDAITGKLPPERAAAVSAAMATASAQLRDAEPAGRG